MQLILYALILLGMYLYVTASLYSYIQTVSTWEQEEWTFLNDCLKESIPVSQPFQRYRHYPSTLLYMLKPWKKDWTVPTLAETYPDEMRQLVIARGVRLNGTL